MNSDKKEQIRALLKGIETGDPESVRVVNEQLYIQHNPHTVEGSIGLAELFKKLSLTSPKVEMIRCFCDGEFVFAHMQYDFSSVKIAFEVFRFEDGLAVEHWDNIQPQYGPSPSGHTMLDGPTLISDHDKTEENRQIVRSFIQNIYINRQLDTLPNYLVQDQLIQHTPDIADGRDALEKALKQSSPDNNLFITYAHCHRILAEGNFVLAICEGTLYDTTTAFYDLFRLEDGKVVEHWDTRETIPPREQWRNNNGKF